MREIISTTSQQLIVPQARVNIAIRAATMDDLPFLDSLQKKHSKALGYFPTKQFEGYIEMGAVLVAVGARPASRCDGAAVDSTRVDRDAGVAPTKPLGYVISRDRYLKRDELGVIYQLCVAPGHQRGLIGASLIKAVFERSAYGCRLYCCWCAQDLDANYFWESLGFVPIAFRAGSDRKRRVHIFWQRRIVEGDTGEKTPWWYPFQTNAGAIRADRIVFPIPPGTHWADVKAVEVPASQTAQLDAPRALDREGASARSRTKSRTPIAAKPATVPLGGFQFQSERPAKQTRAKAAKAGPERSRRIDPTYLKAARELRDRCMERVNDRLLIGASLGKYDVSKTLSEAEGSRVLNAPAPGTAPASPLLIIAPPLRQLPSAA